MFRAVLPERRGFRLSDKEKGKQGEEKAKDDPL